MANIDLERLQYVYKNARFPQKNELYLNALQKGKAATNNPTAKHAYDLETAKHYNDLGNTYGPKTKPEHQWKKKEALAIATKIIAQGSDSLLRNNARLLAKSITRPSVKISAERYVPIGTESLMLVNYKNHNSVSFSVYKVTEDQVKKFNEFYNEDRKNNFLKKLDPLKTWGETLKNEGDHQQHSIELPLPQLKNGRYIIAAALPITTAETPVAFAVVQATNIALVTRKVADTVTLQTVHRNTGKPIAAANCKVVFYNGNHGRSTTKNFKTNAKGEVTLPSNNAGLRNISIKITAGGDTAHFQDHHYPHYGNQREGSLRQKGFIFTDRSIYRPGQPLYYKVIAVQAKAGKSDILAHKKVSVTLYDVNNQAVTTQKLVTNDHGSAAGEFILPTVTLTGQFYLKIVSSGDMRGTAHFSVEEYKRPKFKANFKPITTSYKLNDSITLTGAALAYAGSTVSGAKVTYRVKRRVQLPRWYYWRNPYYNSQAQEIAHGETTTNANGEFSLHFKAHPDLSVKKENQPVFTYEVTADVTDGNGETRSATTTVRVGYHSLLLNIDGAEKLKVETKSSTLTITTKNLNGEGTPAAGTVEIFKLKPPTAVLRDRPWEAPDYQKFTETEFKARFPHEAYAQEADYRNWERGTRYFTSTFESSGKTEVKLGSLKKWSSGKYIIVATATDKFGQQVEDIQFTEVVNKKDTSPADNALFTLQLDKEKYAPGDQVQLKIGAAAEIFVTVLVE
ncbi:MAG: MG2 domain-containing protein, partial [Marinirhabdus sp.]